MSLSVFTPVWSSWCVQPGGKEGTHAAEGAMKPEALVSGAASRQKDHLGPFQAPALAVLLTLWSAPAAPPAQLLTECAFAGSWCCGGSGTSCFWQPRAAGLIHHGS